MAGGHRGWIHTFRYLYGGRAAVVKGSIKTGIKAGGKYLAKREIKNSVAKKSRYLYHYTSEVAADNISRVGLKTKYSNDGFIYLTDKANLKPLQAQIELALPANRALPNSIIRVDTRGLNPSAIRRVQGNLSGLGPGGGIEFLFDFNIPATAIKRIK